MSFRIKKDDVVQVISGRDKGAKGRVLRVFPDAGKAIVENVNFVVEHKKTRNPQKPGGRMTREAPIPLSKLMLVCPKCDKRTRPGVRVEDDGGKVRICKRCKTEL